MLKTEDIHQSREWFTIKDRTGTRWYVDPCGPSVGGALIRRGSLFAWAVAWVQRGHENEFINSNTVGDVCESCGAPVYPHPGIAQPLCQSCEDEPTYV